MENLKIEVLRILCEDETIIMTQHVLDRCQRCGIKYDDVKHAIMSGEIIEHYPDAYPYPACLIFAELPSDKIIHAVIGLGSGELWIVTAYYPTLAK